MTIYQLTVLLVLLNVPLLSQADQETRIAVLDFELNDITSLPNTPAERQRTASMAPLLVEALNQTGGYRVVPIDSAEHQAANGSFGYLFRFHDEAAKLAQSYKAEWLLVSQHSKPSYLFSYLWVYLIDVKKQIAVARYDIELKGNHKTVTEHGIKSLATAIRKTLEKLNDGQEERKPKPASR